MIPRILLALCAGAGMVAAQCVYTLDPATVSVPAGGGVRTVQLTTAAECAWTAVSPVDYIAVSPATGTGSATLTLTTGPNSGAERSAQVQVGAALVNVTQIAFGVNLAPVPLSVTPNNGTGLVQAFTFTFQDLNGPQDILRVQTQIHEGLAPVGCLVYYTLASNEIQLRSGADSWTAPRQLGQPGLLSNEYCTIDVGASTRAQAANNFSLTLVTSFSAAFSGPKQTWAEVLDQQLVSSGYLQLGTWNVPPPGTRPPFTIDVTPNTGSGATASLTARYNDGDGAADLTRVRMMIGPDANTAAGRCLIEARPGLRQVFLMNDSGDTLLGPVAVGAAATLENSQCAVALNGTTLVSNGQVLFTAAVTFKAPLIGANTVFLEATDTSNTSTGFQVAGSWTVTGLGNVAPTPVSMSPNNAGGQTQTFRFLFRDANGATDIQRAQVNFNFGLNAVNACLIYFDRLSGGITLLNDAGTGFLNGVTAGTSGVVQNNQCAIDAARSGWSVVSGDLAVDLAVTFKPALAGVLTAFAEALDLGNLSSGYRQVGSWTVAAVGNFAPTIVSLSPTSGSGGAQTFLLTVSDGNGALDVQRTQLSITGGGRGCIIEYVRATNLFQLRTSAELPPSDSTPATSPRRLNSTNCAVDLQTNALTASGTSLTLSLPVVFANVFAGVKDVRALAVDTLGLSSGERLMGSYTVVQSSNEAPTLVSLTPANGSGLTQTFSLLVRDVNGATDILRTQLNISDGLNLGGCLVYFTRATGDLSLLNETGTAWLGPVRMGQAASVQHSRCTVNGAASSATANGNDLTVNINVTFATGFVGPKQVFAEALDNAGLRVDYTQVGTFNVGGPVGVQAPSTVAVTPINGAGNAQTFTFQFSDANGATDIVRGQIRFSRTGGNAGACLVYYDRATNTLQLLNDAGTAWLPAITMRTANRTQNSQCIVDGAGSRAVAAGTTITLDLTLRFLAPFESPLPVTVASEVLDAAGLTSGYVPQGLWTVQAPSAASTGITLSPTGGTGLSQVFRFTVANALGASDIVRAQFQFSKTPGVVNSCLIYYDRATNTLQLLNDAGTAFTNTIGIGTTATVSNSQCTVQAASSGTLEIGGGMQVDVGVTFKTAFGGAKYVYAEQLSALSGLTSGYGLVGSWIVPY